MPPAIWKMSASVMKNFIGQGKISGVRISANDGKQGDRECNKTPLRPEHISAYDNPSLP